MRRTYIPRPADVNTAARVYPWIGLGIMAFVAILFLLAWLGAFDAR